MMKFGIIAGLILGVIAAAALVVPELRAVSYDAAAVAGRAEGALPPAEEEAQAADRREAVRHEPLPEPLQAVYMTACVAGTPSFREQVVDLIETTEINAVVIDIKDYSGTISFAPENQALRPAWDAAKCGARDMKEFIESLHEKGIFVIGRVTVFQDPFYSARHPELAVKRADGATVWKDFKGLSFIDVGARPYWDYIVALSVDSYNLGFDELNFDYVRYPSDGPMTDIAFTRSQDFPGDNSKQANLESFFKYLNEVLDDESRFAAVRHENTGRESATPWTSVDLFGMTTTNFDDLSIGQVQDRAAPYFDFVAPMVYPSHYPKNAFGFSNPNDHPYEMVYHAMKAGVDRMTASTTPMQGFLHTPIMTAGASGTPQFSGLYQKPAYPASKLRTWIQDFDYGGDYDIPEVRAEIKASRDAGVRSWMVWAPSNIYTKGAFAAQ